MAASALQLGIVQAAPRILESFSLHLRLPLSSTTPSMELKSLWRALRHWHVNHGIRDGLAAAPIPMGTGRSLLERSVEAALERMAEDSSARAGVVRAIAELAKTCEKPLEASDLISLGAAAGAGDSTAMQRLLADKGSWLCSELSREGSGDGGWGEAEGVSVVEVARVVLECCEEAFVERGLGEETLLKPLYRRLEVRENPGQAAVRVANAEGMDGLLRHLRVRV